MPWVPKAIVKKISNRYIAGSTIKDTVACIQKLNREGFCATIDFLGEEITQKSEATTNANEYISVLNAIHQHQLDANISIKPTAMGLLLDQKFCLQTIVSIIEGAHQHGIFVRIDMEDVSCTQKEIDLLLQLKKDYNNVGLALQAYLKRTYEDLTPLLANNINLRLCKGIYREDTSYLVANASLNRTAINPHFIEHAERIFKNGTYLALATHDETLIRQLNDLIQSLELEPNQYEFQMLLGVCESLRNRLKADGHKVRIYVPYGKEWYGYSMRRLKENPQMAGYIFKAIFSRTELLA